MSFIIRDAAIEDVPKITNVYRDAVDNGTATYELTAPDLNEMMSRFESMSSNSYPYIIAEKDDQFLGYAYAGPFRMRPAYRWLVEDSIFLAPEARGQGAGYALLSKLVERAEGLGFRQMVAVIGGGEAASIGVHKKAGFQDAGVLKATGYKHNKWLDTTIMQIELGEGANTDPDMNSYPGNLFSS